MTIRLHCKRCNKFMKDISPQEASSLTGNEICTECEETVRNNIKELDKLYKKLSSELSVKHNAAIVKLEELIHNAFK